MIDQGLSPSREALIQRTRNPTSTNALHAQSRFPRRNDRRWNPPWHRSTESRVYNLSRPRASVTRKCKDKRSLIVHANRETNCGRVHLNTNVFPRDIPLIPGISRSRSPSYAESDMVDGIRDVEKDKRATIFHKWQAQGWKESAARFPRFRYGCVSHARASASRRHLILLSRRAVLSRCARERVLARRDYTKREKSVTKPSRWVSMAVKMIYLPPSFVAELSDVTLEKRWKDVNERDFYSRCNTSWM